MPIITPCYPSMNSSYNVAQPQLRRLKEELFQADKVMNLIANGNAQWSDLLKENGFFKDHLHYLQVSLNFIFSHTVPGIPVLPRFFAILIIRIILFYSPR